MHNKKQKKRLLKIGTETKKTEKVKIVTQNIFGW